MEVWPENPVNDRRLANAAHSQALFVYREIKNY